MRERTGLNVILKWWGINNYCCEKVFGYPCMQTTKLTCYSEQSGRQMGCWGFCYKRTRVLGHGCHAAARKGFSETTHGELFDVFF